MLISVKWDDEKVVVDLKAEEPHLVCVTGSNGIGKTTLFRALLGIEAWSGLSVEVQGASTYGFLPQRAVVFEHLSAWANATIRLRAPQRETVENAASLLDIHTLLKKAGPVGRLSGGEEQRLSILREGLAMPDLLIMDEPGSGLDPMGRQACVEHLRKLVTNKKSVALMSTHSVDDVRMYATSVLHLYRSGGKRCLSYSSIGDFLAKPPHWSALPFSLGAGWQFGEFESTQGALGEHKRGTAAVKLGVGSDPTNVVAVKSTTGTSWDGVLWHGGGIVRLVLNGSSLAECEWSIKESSR